MSSEVISTHLSGTRGWLDLKQRKYREPIRYIRKRFRRRTWPNREIALHCATEPVQVLFQNFQSFRHSDWLQAKSFSVPTPLQCNFSGSLRIPHPLGLTTRGDQKKLAIYIQQVYRRPIQLPRLTPAHFEEIAIRRPKPNSNNESKCP